MSHPDDETLAAFALGDQLPDEVRDHVTSCDACTTTVTDLREVLDLAGGAPTDLEWHTPPASVWEGIRSGLDLADDAQVTGSPVAISEPTPDGAQRVTPIAGTPRTRQSWPRRFAAALAVAAVGVLIGLGVGRSVWNDQPTSTTVSQVALDTLDTGQTGGSAKLIDSGGQMALRVDTTEALDAGDGYLEVWLLNKDGKRMVPVGVLRGAGVEEFPMSASLLENGYTIVDISKEQYDDNPGHSGDSLLRGKLTV